MKRKMKASLKYNFDFFKAFMGKTKIFFLPYKSIGYKRIKGQKYRDQNEKYFVFRNFFKIWWAAIEGKIY